MAHLYRNLRPFVLCDSQDDVTMQWKEERKQSPEAASEREIVTYSTLIYNTEYEINE